MDRAVNYLASYGRHGDDTLLHVSRAELAGIRQLTGKGFTTNPHTGLPEAFNWAKAILPAIAAIGVTALTAGLGAPAALAGLAGAGASGLTTFGVGKAQGESTNKALQEGLIGGATSFAGGQLLSGVGGAAAGAAGDVAANSTSALANTAMAPIDPSVMASTALNQTGQSATPALAASAAEAVPQGISQLAGNTVMPAIDPSQMASSALSTPGPAIDAAAASTAAATPTATSGAPGIGQSFSNLGNRVTSAVSDPGTTLSQIGTNIQKNPFAALTAGAGLYSSLTSPSGSSPKLPGTTPYDPSKYPEQFPTNPRKWTPDPAGYTPGVNNERRYFAKGGIASMRGEEGMTANVVNEAKAALLNEHPRPREALARFESMFGGDALDVLRDKIAGGRVTGAGGGMDDLVPGTIEGRQKVRLADGEFVLPAPIVSAIGDGSTDQGVRRLHEMMNSIYKQKYKSDGLPKRLKKGTLVDGS
jgi:hypothetical protein